MDIQTSLNVGHFSFVVNVGTQLRFVTGLWFFVKTTAMCSISFLNCSSSILSWYELQFDKLIVNMWRVQRANVYLYRSSRFYIVTARRGPNTNNHPLFGTE
eukprot:GHVR01023996.1.p1 GENE.GHVR01023996.1~~GHVR01023996.1.p1  ORF type:complete len:101 (-),score=0.73 GHVR01023996.1:18-320(-)